MIIVYTEKDIERILREHHRYGENPIKIGYSTKEIEAVSICEDTVRVLIEEEDDNDD